MKCALWDGLVGAAVAGRAGQAVLMVGEPGIGKTRLLDELGDRVRRAGGVLLYARAFEAEQARPYGIWIEALRPLLAESIAPSLRARLAPLLPADSGADGASLNREGLFETVGQLLSQAAGTAPVAVLLDDIQWIDEVSAALLHYIARSPGSGRMLLACAARAGELGTTPPAYAP
jgi:predicted ATPase